MSAQVQFSVSAVWPEGEVAPAGMGPTGVIRAGLLLLLASLSVCAAEEPPLRE